MTITVHRVPGPREDREIEDGTTVDELLRELDEEQSVSSSLLNGSSSFDSDTPLGEGDEVVATLVAEGYGPFRSMDCR